MFHIPTFSTRMPRFARGLLPAAAILLAVTSAAQAATEPVPTITYVVAGFDQYGFVQDGSNSLTYQPGSQPISTTDATLTLSSLESRMVGNATFTDTVTLAPSTTGTSQIDGYFQFNWLMTMVAHASVGSDAAPGSLARAVAGLEMFSFNFTIETPMLVNLISPTNSAYTYPTFHNGDTINPGTYTVVFDGTYVDSGPIGIGNANTYSAQFPFGLILQAPEPASLALLGIGAAALVLRRHRKA